MPLKRHVEAAVIVIAAIVLMLAAYIARAWGVTL